MPRDLCALVADAGANIVAMNNFGVNKVDTEDLHGSSEVKVKQDNQSCDAAGLVVGKGDMAKALERSKKRNASALGAPKVN